MGTVRVALTWDQVLSWRMQQQLLPRRVDVTAVDVVRRLAGVQAQVSSAAEQAVAVRRPGARADITPALADRSLVRTWAQRGTLHLLPAEELASYLSLIADARTWEKPVWQREFATAEQMAEIATAAAEVLRDAELTREELAAEIADRTGDPDLAEALRSGWARCSSHWPGRACCATQPATTARSGSPARPPGCRRGRACPIQAMRRSS